MLRLGSLFSGSGGFELAGSLNGIEPVWASEIEPYPIAVTRSRFHNMKHLGDVSKISGTEVEPVDIITFGSPCQDLSIAGNRKGIEDGVRSSLFFQAVRIIREMREATHGVYPAFVLWENVFGAFSSNGGNDFRLVLESLARVSEPKVSIPMPKTGKWQPAGEIVGDGWSVAWRTLDAQGWGVAQRRKRIYLVADFGGERARTIFVEQDSVRGDSAKGREAREGTASDVKGSTGRSGGNGCLNPWDTQSSRLFDAQSVFHTLQSGENAGMQRDGVVIPQAILENQEGSVWLADHTGALQTSGGKAGQGYQAVVQDFKGFGETGIGYWKDGIQCLRAEGENRPSRPSNVVVGEPVLSWTYRGREGGCKIEYTDGAAYALREPTGGGSQPLVCMPSPIAFHASQDPISSEEHSPCLGANATIGVASFMGGQGSKAGGIGYSEEVSPTLKSVLSGGNTVPDVVYPTVARTLEARYDSSPCVDRGQNVIVCDVRNGTEDSEKTSTLQAGADHTLNAMPIVCIHDKATRFQGGGETRSDDGSGNGLGVSESGVEYTLTAADRHGVVYPNVTGTLCASGAGMNRPAGQGNEADMVVAYPCLASQKDAVGTLMANCATKMWLGNQEAFSGDYTIIDVASPQPEALPMYIPKRRMRKYIVRRLLPV